VTPARYEAVGEAAQVVQSRIGAIPDVAIVLGSGLGSFAHSLADAVVVPYATIPHWPASKIVGHAGELVAGTVGGRRVLALSGRAHVYEGHAMAVATFATRVLGLLGVKSLILTNAAGGINTSFAQGALMLISDHINLMGTNPLVGPNDERFGPRFPDMTAAYSPRLRQAARDAAAAAGIRLEEGVYIAVIGPSYETPAEIRAFRVMGADAVGMSTVPETIVARHMGMEVAGISCITNMAAGVLNEPLVHDEVMATAARVRDQFIALLTGLIARI
jgi:purine-nucleoside phosphorylase